MGDTVPPTISCTSNQQVNTDFNLCSHKHLGTSWDAIGMDNCPGFTITYLLSGATTDTLYTLANADFNKGLTNIQATIVDGAGLSATCAFTVTVTDAQPPNIIAPPSQTLPANTPPCVVSGISLGMPTASDNCPGYTVSNNAPTIFPLGATVVTWTVTDAGGLTATATQTITVQSTLAVTAFTLSDTQICSGNSATLSLSLNGGMPPYTVVYTANGSPVTKTNYINNQLILLTPAVTTVYAFQQVTDAAGCMVSTPAFQDTLEVNSSPSFSNLSVSDTLVCGGTGITMLASGLVPNVSTTFYYTLSPGGSGSETGTSSGSGTYSFAPLTNPAGSYSYTLDSISLGACTIPLTINNTAAFTILQAPTLGSLNPTAQEFCEGSPAAFVAAGLLPSTAASFYFTLTPGGPGMLNATSTAGGTLTFPVMINGPGMYSMKIDSIAANGCTVAFSSGNTASYTVNPMPTLSALDLSSTSVCQGDSVVLTLSGLFPSQSATLEYLSTPGGTSTQTFTSSPNGSHSLLLPSDVPGMYGISMVSITTLGCTSDFNLSASYNVKPKPTLSNLQPSVTQSCVGDSVFFTATGLLPNATSTFAFTLAPGGTGSLTGASNAAGNYMFPSASNPPGNYSMSVQSITVAGCTSVFTTGNAGSYAVSPHPTISSIAPSAGLVCEGTPVSILASGLLPNANFSITYLLNGVMGTAVVSSNPLGQATFLSNNYPVGNYELELTAIANAGCSTATSLSTMFMVNPPQALCGLTVAGNLSTETDNGVSDALVSISGGSPSVPTFAFTEISDTAGDFSFVNAIPLNSYFDITPYKNDNPLNGVTTYDLVLISKHILGLSPLDSPYKIIAADANKSNSVTTFDIVELRKLILGIYDELPANTSWRFIDKDFVFSQPDMPFNDIFPESIQETDLQASALNNDFIGIKVGDVNASAISNGNAPTEIRSDKAMPLLISDGTFKAGDILTCTFQVTERVTAFQFTLEFPGLEVMDILPGNNLSVDNFGLFPDAITMSCIPENALAFSVVFRAQTSGNLSDHLFLSNRITPTVAYEALPNTSIVEEQKIVLFYQQPDHMENNSTQLLQNVPNPWVKSTDIQFRLYSDSPVSLRIFNETGQLLYQKEQELSEGYHVITLENAALKGSGVLYYTLQTNAGTYTRSMLKLRM